MRYEKDLWPIIAALFNAKNGAQSFEFLRQHLREDGKPNKVDKKKLRKLLRSYPYIFHEYEISEKDMDYRYFLTEDVMFIFKASNEISQKLRTLLKLKKISKEKRYHRFLLILFEARTSLDYFKRPEVPKSASAS